MPMPATRRVAQRRRWLRRSLKVEHSRVPRLDAEPVGFLARSRCLLRRRPDRCAEKALARFCTMRDRMRRAAMDRQAATDCGGLRAGHNGGHRWRSVHVLARVVQYPVQRLLDGRDELRCILVARQRDADLFNPLRDQLRQQTFA